jgi:transporter family-2 protein
MGMFSVDKKYMLFGGVMGAFITWTVIKSMDGLGPAKATLLIVVTQILVSYLVEVFGLFGVEKVGFEWRKLLGAVIAIGGIIVFRW